MHYVIHCAGMPFNGESFKKQSLGGSETAAYYVAKELAYRGHEVMLFTTHPEDCEVDGVKYIWMGESSQSAPAGERFMRYATKMPHDVLIIQRQPHFFGIAQYASKINILWTHDLALYRHKEFMSAGLPYIDAVMGVSDWHNEQMKSIYGLQDSVLGVLPNGVDLELYEKPLDTSEWPEELSTKRLLTYTHRPERGLENLVKPGGIMEKVAEAGIDDAMLVVAGYDNTAPQMERYYNYLWGRCAELPNVVNLGSLTKENLAQLQLGAFMHVYPTEFEETSCITAMECMAAGLPMLTTNVGALPETTKGSGVNTVNFKDFTSSLIGWLNGDSQISRGDFVQLQKKAAKRHTWRNSCDCLEDTIYNIIAKQQQNLGSMARTMMQNSDIYLLRYYLQNNEVCGLPMLSEVREELDQCYAFTKESSWDEHYEQYYQYEADRGVEYGPENLDGNARFEYVSSVIHPLHAGSVILDYGCAHGHYTVNLAKRFPDKRFIGVDIAASNIDKATKWAADEELSNVKFYQGRVIEGKIQGQSQFPDYSLEVDAVIAAEVLEHVEDYEAHIGVLASHLKLDGLFIATTPYGPWEAQGYREHWPWRAHVHHFDKQDIKEVVGHMPDYKIAAIPASARLGSYVWQFRRGKDPLSFGTIDYDRKISEYVPRQTVSLCMITDNLKEAMGAVKSATPIIDEIIIGVDSKDGVIDEGLKKELDSLFPDMRILVYPLEESPIESGFSVARNDTISLASGDWILWLDTDEVLEVEHPGPSLLRNNQFNAISVPQHNFSVHPPGILATDLPCRLFRNYKSIQFNGLIHEHPETKLNEGIPPTLVQSHIAIAHMSYRNNDIRRGRFDRNLELMARDRKETPERVLGQFLWLRDLAQMNAREGEVNGGAVTEDMIMRFEEGCRMWNMLLDTDHSRLQRDALEFYTMLLTTVSRGFVATSAIAYDVIGKAPPQPTALTGRFLDKDDLSKFVLSQIKEIPDVEEKYL